MFVLGEDQVNAINNIKDFLHSDKLCYSVIGYAGTGKSTIIKEVVDYLEQKWINYVLCAPTHKAKVVLERFTGRSGVTLHKLLSLAPNIEILNLDFRELKFYMGDKPLFPTDGVVICDESSMVSDDLFTLLEQKCKQYNCKIVFFGDKAQLRPVNAITHSKVFDLETRSELKHIYRQSSESGLVDILPILREKIIPKFSDKIGSEGSLICSSNIKEFFKQAIPIFRKAINNSDILETKMLAYTNSRVNAFNLKIKELLFDNDDEYCQHEILTGYENLEFNKHNFWNSMDYIVADPPKKCDVYIEKFLSVPGYKLNLYDSSEKSLNEVFILSREISKDYFESLAQVIEVTRLEAIEAKKLKSRYSGKKWGEYYQILGSFTTPVDLYYDNRVIRKKSFDYGYSTTIHKSQGSSINNVFIDMDNVFQCKDKEELRQLQYVSVSRSKNNVYMYQT